MESVFAIMGALFTTLHLSKALTRRTQGLESTIEFNESDCKVVTAKGINLLDGGLTSAIDLLLKI